MCPRQHNEETIALGFWANALITFGLCLISADHHLSIITPAFLLGRAGSHSFLSLQPLLHVCENTASLPHHEFSEHWDLCWISYSFFHRVCVGSHFTDPVCTLRYLHWGSSLFRVLDWNPTPAIVFPLLHFIIYLFTYLLARQNCMLRGKKKNPQQRPCLNSGLCRSGCVNLGKLSHLSELWFPVTEAKQNLY